MQSKMHFLHFQSLGQIAFNFFELLAPSHPGHSHHSHSGKWLWITFFPNVQNSQNSIFMQSKVQLLHFLSLRHPLRLLVEVLGPSQHTFFSYGGIVWASGLVGRTQVWRIQFAPNSAKGKHPPQCKHRPSLSKNNGLYILITTVYLS